jgi:hypothetical protein
MPQDENKKDLIQLPKTVSGFDFTKIKAIVF